MVRVPTLIFGKIIVPFDCFAQDAFHFRWLHARTFATAKPGLFSKLRCIDFPSNNGIAEVFALFFGKSGDVGELVTIVAA